MTQYLRIGTNGQDALVLVAPGQLDAGRVWALADVMDASFSEQAAVTLGPDAAAIP